MLPNTKMVVREFTLPDEQYYGYYSNQPQLYDLENDPEEKVNLAKEYPDIVTFLSEKINNQLIKIKDKLSELNTYFSQQITDENLQMLITYDVIQANVVFLKVDMLQSLNISVDYADADGD